jgi:hypothetical protein
MEIHINVSVQGDVELSDDVRIELKRWVPLLAGPAVKRDSRQKFWRNRSQSREIRDPWQFRKDPTSGTRRLLEEILLWDERLTNQFQSLQLGGRHLIDPYLRRFGNKWSGMNGKQTLQYSFAYGHCAA